MGELYLMSASFHKGKADLLSPSKKTFCRAMLYINNLTSSLRFKSLIQHHYGSQFSPNSAKDIPCVGHRWASWVSSPKSRAFNQVRISQFLSLEQLNFYPSGENCRTDSDMRSWSFRDQRQGIKRVLLCRTRDTSMSSLTSVSSVEEETAPLKETLSRDADVSWVESNIGTLCVVY